MSQDQQAAPARWSLTGLADLLNEQFVGIARGIDALTVKAARLFKPASDKTYDAQQRRRAEAQALRCVRVKLADLHLRVGKSIYRLEQQLASDAPVAQQLGALLDEIERLEDLLRRADAESSESMAPELMEDVERLLASDDEPGNRILKTSEASEQE